MKTLLTIILTATATMLITQEFSPLRSGLSAHTGRPLLSQFSSSSSPAVPIPAAGLLSPEELQQQINAVLLRYRMPAITEDGRLGAETCRAYHEAYSLQQVEEWQKHNYTEAK